MLCCGRKKDGHKEHPVEMAASPRRQGTGHEASSSAPGSSYHQPGGMHPLSSVATGALGHHHQPHSGSPGTGLRSMVVQSDFRKVSGISTEIFRQIETVENDHDATTAAALEAVERRGEMLVRVLDPRNMGRAASEAARSFLAVQDPKHSVHFVEIVKRPGQTLGLYIREGNGIDRPDGVFISRIALESPVYNSGCLRVGDEILAINLVDVTRMSLDDVVIVMSIPRRLVLTTRQRRGPPGAVSPPPPRPEQKPPPVVVLKRGVQPEEPLDDNASNSTSNNGDRPYASPYAQHRFMTTGKPLPGMADLPVHGTFPRGNREQRDPYREREAGRYPERTIEDPMRQGGDHETLGQFYSSYRTMEQQRSQYSQPMRSGGTLERQKPGDPPMLHQIDSYHPPPPLPVTEQPKTQHYPFDRPSFGQKTLESLAERVHPFYGLQGGPPQSIGRSSTLGRQSNRSQGALGGPGSSMSLMRTPNPNRLTRSGSDQRLPAVEGGGDLYDYLRGKPQYPSRQQGLGVAPRRRTSVDYASDTEASTRSYSRRAESSGTWKAPPPLLGLATPMSVQPDSRSNSLPRGGSLGGRYRREVHFEPGAPSPRPTGPMLDSAEDSDGAVSAPEMSVSQKQKQLQRLNQQLQYAQGILSGAAAAAAAGTTPGNFTSAEYKAWMSRAPSTSAIYESLRQVRDPAEQKRSVKLTFSAENLVEKTKQEMAYYSYRSHFTGGKAPEESDPLKMMETDQSRSSLMSQSAPSKSSDARFKLLDINASEFVKYRSERPNGSSQPANQQLPVGNQTAMPTPSASTGTGPAPGGGVEEGVSGLLWIHLLAGRGLRSTSSRLEPVRDLYCVLECDRAHKARTVIRSGDVNFDWDETFDLDLVVNRELDFLIYSWDPQLRHRLCFKGSLHLVPLLRESPTHQVALKVEPRGTLYLKLRYTEPRIAFRRSPAARKTPPPLFGVDLETVVNREGGGSAPGLLTGGNGGVPIIVQKCVEEVERRGMDIVGLYRLCGSATKKRILREAFERNPRLVDLSPDSVPDINVITGLLKEYLRELPEPLLTKCLYQMLVDALAVCLPDDPEGNAKLMFSILECLPKGNRTTLFLLMDHLCLVTAQSDRNKMTPQNLAICFGPVLMLHSGDSSNQLEFQKPIGVLKYLLQIWPMKSARAVEAAATASSTLRRIQPPPQQPPSRPASALGARLPQQQPPASSSSTSSSSRPPDQRAASDQCHPPSDRAPAPSSSSTSFTSSISSSVAQVAQAAAQVAQQAQQALSSSDRNAISLTQSQGRGLASDRRLDLPPLPPRPAPRVVAQSKPASIKSPRAEPDSINRGEADGSPAPLSIDSAPGAGSETPSLTSPTSTTSTTSLSSHQPQQQQQRSSSVTRRYDDDNSHNKRNQASNDDTDHESDLESPN